MIRQDPYRDLGRDCSAKLVERSGSEQRALLDQPVPGADLLGIPELVSAEKDSDIFLQSEIPDQPVHVLGTFGDPVRKTRDLVRTLGRWIRARARESLCRIPVE